MGIISFIKNYKINKQRLIEEKRRIKEESEAAKIAEKKRIYRLTKTKIDEYIESIKQQEHEAYDKAYDIHKELSIKKNTICPHCGSKNVHMEYKRIVGGLSGSSSSSESSSYSYGLFGGSGSSHFSSYGKIDGSLDTLRVLKCSDCGQEWEYTEEHLSSFDYYAGKIDLDNDIDKFMRYLYYILDVEYDPKDITEKFDSYEEKHAVEIDKFWKALEYKEYMKSLPIEVLWALTVKYSYDIADTIIETIWTKKVVRDEWGDLENRTTYSNERDKYICEFSPETLSLLEELGFKHINLSE